MVMCQLGGIAVGPPRLDLRYLRPIEILQSEGTLSGEGFSMSEYETRWKTVGDDLPPISHACHFNLDLMSHPMRLRFDAILLRRATMTKTLSTNRTPATTRIMVAVSIDASFNKCMR
jgi:hypothetical protein